MLWSSGRMLEDTTACIFGWWQCCRGPCAYCGSYISTNTPQIMSTAPKLLCAAQGGAHLAQAVSIFSVSCGEATGPSAAAGVARPSLPPSKSPCTRQGTTSLPTIPQLQQGGRVQRKADHPCTQGAHGARTCGCGGGGGGGCCGRLAAAAACGGGSAALGCWPSCFGVPAACCCSCGCCCAAASAGRPASKPLGPLSFNTPLLLSIHESNDHLITAGTSTARMCNSLFGLGKLQQAIA